MTVSTDDIKSGMSYAEISNVDSPALYTSLTADVVPQTQTLVQNVQELIQQLADPNADHTGITDTLVNMLEQMQAALSQPISDDLVAQQTVQQYIAASAFSDVLTANSAILETIRK